jgi:hypothetical protein
MVSLNQIFAWFKTGLKPTEEQFKETFSSFWHRSEKIPGTSIDGFPALTSGGQENSVKIWIGMAADLPADVDRVGTKTLYIAIEDNAELE